MKIKVWSNVFKKYIPPEEWYINSECELFFENMMDGELTKAPKGSYEIIFEQNPCNSENREYNSTDE